MVKWKLAMRLLRLHEAMKLFIRLSLLVILSSMVCVTVRGLGAMTALAALATD